MERSGDDSFEGALPSAAAELPSAVGETLTAGAAPIKTDTEVARFDAPASGD